MPIVTKTIKEDPGYPGDLWYTDNKACKYNMYNRAKALSEAVGSEFIEITYPDDATRLTFYVPMASIGYPGWCVSLETWHDDRERAKVGVRLFDDSSNSPYQEDINFAACEISSVQDRLSFLGEHSDPVAAETCVMMSDINNDTVMFDIHNGVTYRGDGLSYSDERHFRARFTIFFAKDVNGEVLCGVGDSCIYELRTKDRLLRDEGLTSTKALQRAGGLASVLHVTKMVNYLSPGYPEMKSAYISVIRPFEDVSSNKRICLYNLNGVDYGSAGDTDVYLTMLSKQGSFASSHGTYFPFNPLVKY